MTLNRVCVVCEGPKGGPHPRRLIRSYMRMPWEPPEWHLLPPGIRPLELLHAEDWPVHGHLIRLRCPVCRFDEKRRLDRDYGNDYPPFSAVFEKLRNAGVREISVWALVGLVWDV